MIFTWPDFQLKTHKYIDINELMSVSTGSCVSCDDFRIAGHRGSHQILTF